MTFQQLPILLHSFPPAAVCVSTLTCAFRWSKFQRYDMVVTFSEFPRAPTTLSSMKASISSLELCFAYITNEKCIFYAFNVGPPALRSDLSATVMVVASLPIPCGEMGPSLPATPNGAATMGATSSQCLMV